MPPVIAAYAAFASTVAGFIASAGGLSLVSSVAVYQGAYFALTRGLLYAALSVGSTLYSRNQAKKAMRSMRSKGQSVMIREPTAPRQIIYGEVRTSGPILFVHTTGVKNETLFLIVGLAGHQVEAIDTIFFDDKPLLLDGSGNVTSAPYAGKAQITKFLGTDSQTAAAALIAAAPDKWTASHRLRGIAYVLVKLTFDTTAFPTGLPNVSAVVRGRQVLDTRTGVTAYSSNWALCVRDYLTNTTLGLGTDASEIDTTALNAAANISDEDVVTATSITRSCDIASGNVNIGMTTQLVSQLDGIIEGQRVSGSGIPAGSLVTFVNREGPSFFFQIDKAPTATGSAVSVIFGAVESRYTINGVITTDAAPGDVLEKLVIAGAGFCSYIGGKWVIHAGAYRTPTVTLDENDLRGPISVQTKVSRREIFNGVKGTFFSPENQWQAADFPPIVNATYTSEDGGERIWQDVELPFTTSSATAQRLAKIALERVRQQITVRLPCKLTAFRLQVGDTVMLTNARLGFAAKDFEVTELAFAAEDQGGAQALAIDLTLRETAEGVWDWNDGEETVIDLAPNTNLPNPRDIPTPTGLTLTSGSSTEFIQEDGTVVPRLKAVWDSPPNEFVLSGGFTRVEFKESADTDFLEWNTVGGDITEEYITDVLIGVSYDVRVRHVNRIGALGAYQTVAGHVVAGTSTAPATPTGGALSSDGVVPKFFSGTRVQVFGTQVSWLPNTESDFAYYEVKATTTNSDAAVDYSWSPFDGSSNFEIQTTEERCFLYNALLQPGFVRVRAVNRSGLASAYASLGNANGAASFGTGTVSKQDSDDLEITGITTGSSTAPKVLVRDPGEATATLVGGSTTEKINIAISSRGFSTKPDTGFVRCTSNFNLETFYDKGDAGSTSTNAVVFCFMNDGANLPAGLQAFIFEFIEND